MGERTLFVSWVATPMGSGSPYRAIATASASVSFGDTTVTITREGYPRPDINGDDIARIRSGIAAKLPTPANVTILSLFELD